MNWYKTTENIKNATHKGVTLKPNKYLRLTESQAQLHNKSGVVVEKSDAPSSVEQCQFKEDMTAEPLAPEKDTAEDTSFGETPKARDVRAEPKPVVSNVPSSDAEEVKEGNVKKKK